MNEKTKNIITVVLVCIILFGSLFTFVFSKDKEFSVSERRKLEQMPEFNLQSVANGSYMSDFTDYLNDQFPFRDSLRKLKAFSGEYIFNTSDNNGYYRYKNHIAEIEYPLDISSINRAASIFNDIYNRDLKDKNTKVYLSVIPDKNAYTGKLSNHPTMDYSLLLNTIKSNTEFATYIDLFNLVDESDFYYTDLHIRQEKAIDIANVLCENMGAQTNNDFKENVSDYPFYGVYYGHSALNTKADTLKYLTNDIIDSAKVYDFEKNEYVGVYNTDALNSNDAYSFFLHGTKSLLKIENQKAQSSKRLIIFRDSFASSLAPLMLNGYSEITLVDIRYMSASMVGNFINFENSDVLFLYSTSILNSSINLKR